MVTAIAIPLLFLYFYYLTRKERKKFYNKWLQIGKVAEESFVKGTIVGIREKTERYYYHYSIYIIDLLLQHENEKNRRAHSISDDGLAAKTIISNR